MLFTAKGLEKVIEIKSLKPQCCIISVKLKGKGHPTLSVAKIPEKWDSKDFIVEDYLGCVRVHVHTVLYAHVQN
jgi:hypothetical protein